MAKCSPLVGAQLWMSRAALSQPVQTVRCGEDCNTLQGAARKANGQGEHNDTLRATESQYLHVHLDEFARRDKCASCITITPAGRTVSEDEHPAGSWRYAALRSWLCTLLRGNHRLCHWLCKHCASKL